MNKEKFILNTLGVVPEDTYNLEELYNCLKTVKEAKNVIEKYEKETLKPILFDRAEELGDKDDNGGYAVKLDDDTGWKKQARNSVNVNQEKAVELMDDKKLYEYIDEEEKITKENMEAVVKFLKASGREDLITKERSVSEDSLEQAYLNQQISDDELGGLVERKTTYALVEIKPKKKKSKK